VDYSAPDAEPEEPKEDLLSPEEYAKALKRVEERKVLIFRRKAVCR
jgi:hypothetical protein